MLLTLKVVKSDQNVYHLTALTEPHKQMLLILKVLKSDQNVYHLTAFTKVKSESLIHSVAMF